MRTRTILLGVSALVMGFLLVFSAFVWWTVNGIAAIDTADGEPPGPLHGYGVTAILVFAGLSGIALGLRRMAVGRS